MALTNKAKTLLQGALGEPEVTSEIIAAFEGGSGGLQSVTVELPAETLKNGDSIELIPAPGAGKIIQVQSMLFHMKGNTTNYNPGSSATFEVAPEGYEWVGRLTHTQWALPLASTESATYIIGVRNLYFQNGGKLADEYQNTPIVAYVNDTVAAGDHQIWITVNYVVVDLPY